MLTLMLFNFLFGLVLKSLNFIVFVSGAKTIDYTIEKIWLKSFVPTVRLLAYFIFYNFALVPLFERTGLYASN